MPCLSEKINEVSGNILVYCLQVLILSIIFVILFCIELSLTRFHRTRDKYYWFAIVLVFGVIG